MLSRKTFFGFIHKEKEAQGFILGKIVGDEIEIITFCVLPRFQNSGIGKMLVDKIDDYAKIHSVHRIFLEVSENNTVAKNIYKGFGYKEISKRIKYYPTGDCLQNAIIMRKDIIPNSIIK
jgi:ribosomal-protein-alanine N-acetyltransferase